MAKYGAFQYSFELYGDNPIFIDQTSRLRTYPDYGTYASPIISPDIDMAELSARIGAPAFRREGRILSYADFSPSLQGWKMSVPGANTWIDSENSFVGGASIHFKGDHPTNPLINRWIPQTISRRVGLEFNILNGTQNNRFTPSIFFFNGATGYKAAILFYASTGEIFYYNQFDTGTWLANIPILMNTLNWVNVKIVADGDASPPIFVRLLIDNVEIPMNQQLPAISVSPASHGLYTKISCGSADGVNPYEAYIDAVLITTNEH